MAVAAYGHLGSFAVFHDGEFGNAFDGDMACVTWFSIRLYTD